MQLPAALRKAGSSFRETDHVGNRESLPATAIVGHCLIRTHVLFLANEPTKLHRDPVSNCPQSCYRHAVSLVSQSLPRMHAQLSLLLCSCYSRLFWHER